MLAQQPCWYSSSFATWPLAFPQRLEHSGSDSVGVELRLKWLPYPARPTSRVGRSSPATPLSLSLKALSMVHRMEGLLIGKE